MGGVVKQLENSKFHVTTLTLSIILMLVMWNGQASLGTVLAVDGSPPLSCADPGVVCDSLFRCTYVPNDVLIFLRSLRLPRHEHGFSKLACFKSKQLKSAIVPNRLD